VIIKSGTYYLLECEGRVVPHLHQNDKRALPRNLQTLKMFISFPLNESPFLKLSKCYGGCFLAIISCSSEIYLRAPLHLGM
jgi:hypothetical protein